ncbi:uncharacterized protein I206_105620 [Kwoniella pini CBS 10737]|uniref:Uncharacterized protein n=1 Tax=Kwoniella pini CBS 10737 TaxID=1296096 RepID=A0A1B9I3V0_9TREE|nr:uncharacterized protein I206_03480 [Kwoniella pini CBS 10737]OCF50161.1 hypothetical protein I206_03480 [Kwoniella pini CBS 10737]
MAPLAETAQVSYTNAVPEILLIIRTTFQNVDQTSDRPIESQLISQASIAFQQECFFNSEFVRIHKSIVEAEHVRREYVLKQREYATLSAALYNLQFASEQADILGAPLPQVLQDHIKEAKEKLKLLEESTRQLGLKLPDIDKLETQKVGCLISRQLFQISLKLIFPKPTKVEIENQQAEIKAISKELEMVRKKQTELEKKLKLKEKQLSKLQKVEAEFKNTNADLSAAKIVMSQDQDDLVNKNTEINKLERKILDIEKENTGMKQLIADVNDLLEKKNQPLPTATQVLEDIPHESKVESQRLTGADQRVKPTKQDYYTLFDKHHRQTVELDQLNEILEDIKFTILKLEGEPEDI